MVLKEVDHVHRHQNPLIHEVLMYENEVSNPVGEAK